MSYKMHYICGGKGVELHYNLNICPKCHEEGGIIISLCLFFVKDKKIILRCLFLCALVAEVGL